MNPKSNETIAAVADNFPIQGVFTGALDGWEEVDDYALDWALNPVATGAVEVG